MHLVIWKLRGTETTKQSFLSFFPLNVMSAKFWKLLMGLTEEVIISSNAWPILKFPLKDQQGTKLLLYIYIYIYRSVLYRSGIIAFSLKL